MRPFLYALAMVGNLLVLLKVLITIAEWRRWPPLIVHPFWCGRCQRGYRTDWLYTMHIRAQHRPMYGPLKERIDKHLSERDNRPVAVKPPILQIVR